MTSSDKIKEADIKHQLSDPSALTTQMMLREISSLKELISSQLENINKGISVAHEDLVRVPTEVQKQVGGLKELLSDRITAIEKFDAEKFIAIEKSIGIVEQARVEQKRDTATAVDAALKAAKEAVSELNASNAMAINKSEASMAKQIEQQSQQIQIITKAFDEKVNDLKERLARNEGKGSGLRDAWALIVAAIAILFALLDYFK